MNEQVYSTGRAHSWRDRAECAVRNNIYNVLASVFPIEDFNSIIDVGVTADETKDSSNFFEKTYPYPERITAFSNQDASFLTGAYKGLRFVRGTALDMPFGDGAFDLCFSHAVIEHVGSRENQLTFLKECIRIARGCS